MSENLNIAIMGATGNVGKTLINILYERQFPAAQIHAIASNDSIGKKISFGKNNKVIVKSLDNLNFYDIDLVFSCVDNNISSKIVPVASAAGAIVIDKSSYFRMKDDIPLIIPEVNGSILNNKNSINSNIVANPNCCVIPLMVALKPLDDFAKIKRLVISTYQSTSGAGKTGMDELYNQTKSKLYQQPVPKPNIFIKPIAFNIIPQIGTLLNNGYYDEEDKIINEIQKIMERRIEISVTCVRVPTFIGHCFSVNVEFDYNIDDNKAEELLTNSNGIKLINKDNDQKFITPIDTVGKDHVFVSRIRKNTKNTLNLWVSTDNLRKGAALNAVQIAEKLILENMI